MDDSILNTIKKLLGIDAEYNAFDIDIQMHINSVFSVMHQIGAAPPSGFWIQDATTKWSDFIEGRQHVEMVKSYMYFKVRLMFDPPATSFAIDAIKSQIADLEWRLNIMEFTFNPKPAIP